MHSLKANLINKEQSKILKDKISNSNSNQNFSQTMNPSQNTPLFQKNPRNLKAFNPLADSQKQITIKKILNEIEKDLVQAEEENYVLIKEQAEQRMLKANPKLAAIRQKQIEKEIKQQQVEQASPLKGGANKLQQPDKQKKVIKDTQNEEIQFLNGQFVAHIKLNKFDDEEKDKEKPVYTYQQHRLFLKKNGVTYFEKYEPPKKEQDEGAQSQPVQDESKPGSRKQNIDPVGSLQRNFSLPSLNENKRGKQKMQSMKQEQDQLIFNEVFIQPRAQKLSQIMIKHQEQQQNFISSTSIGTRISTTLPPLHNQSVQFEKERSGKKDDANLASKYFLDNREQRLMNDKSKIELSALLQSQKLMEQSEKLFDKELNQQSANQNRVGTAYSMKSVNESELLDDQDPMVQGDSNHVDDIVKIVMRKFNSSARLQNSTSFFTQQIQVQPPEGLINSIGNNVKDASWAPSIPISTTLLKQSSLKDITLRAKAGVQAGDIQKEAHMAFALGNLNEEEKNYKKAIKFYKRFFFCARILEDPVGASLGLNRLGVMYHKLKNYSKSLQFHQKHMQFTDNENIFASYYNLGISFRLQRDFDESTRYFKLALEWSQQHQEFESECISNGQLGVTYLIIRNHDSSKSHFENCLKVASNLKNKKLQLDCLLCLGFISYISDEYKVAKNYFHKAFSAAQFLNEKEIAEQCLCNMGIAMGNISVQNMKRNFSVENLTIDQHESEDDEDQE